MTMTNFEKLVSEFHYHQSHADYLRACLEQEKTKLRKTVEFTKNGNRYEFRKGDRIVKAKPNNHGRYKVWEGKNIIDSDYLGNLATLRLNIALGVI